MLSYRHGYHAGNHGDVLKHWVQVLCLQYLKQKDKPFFYIDTHSGAGSYSLAGAFAKKTGEAEGGIVKLWQQKKLPPGLADYVQVVKSVNKDKLFVYPGSPCIAAAMMRRGDRLRLVEMHGSDVVSLRKLMDKDRRVQIIEGDGFQQIKALLPPAARRGLVLMDPSYEIKSDYPQVITALNEGIKRFANGIYLVWYPLINSVAAQRYSEQLQKIPCESWLNVKLTLSRPPEGHGMYGSGVFVINPPWTLREQLEKGLPELTQILAQDETAQWSVQTKG